MTTNANIDFSNDITDGVVAGTVNSMTIGSGGTATVITDSKWLKLGDNTSTVTIPEAGRAGYGQAGNRDVVTISFKMAWGNKNGMGSGFRFKDADGSTIASFQYARWDGSSTNSNTLGITDLPVGAHSGNLAVIANATSFSIAINYVTSTITTTATLGATTKTYYSSLTNTNPMATFEVFGYNVGGNADRASIFDDLLITRTEGDYSAADANYTVKFVDGEGTEIDDEVVHASTEGASISLSATDKETRYNFENTKKYTYVSDDSEGKVVAGDNSTVVTVVFDTHNRYNYSVTGSMGADIDTGYMFDDESKVVSWSKYVEKDGIYYMTNAPFTFTVNSSNPTKEVAFAASTVTQFVEATWSNWAGTGAGDSNCSNGDAWRGVSGGVSKTMLTVEETGIYNVLYTVFSTNTGTGKEFDVSIYKNDASSDANLLETFSVNHSITYILSTGSRKISDVALAAGDKIIIKSGNTTCAIDYIALERSATPVTLGTNGYATYASPFALNLAALPDGLKAYKASVDGTTVRFTEVNTAVPANTGLLLQGNNSGEYNIPVAASGSAVAENAFLVNTAGTTFTGDGDYYYFGLKANTLTFGTFDPSTVAIPANKAYLKVLKSSIGAGARELRAVFGDDETTAISSTENAVKAGKAEVYNLQGQRVTAPTKGLYIINGKKVVLK